MSKPTTTTAASLSANESQEDARLILELSERHNVSVRTVVDCDGSHATYDRFNRVAYVCVHLNADDRRTALVRAIEQAGAL
ncbi:hypothetical protein [Aeromicrobium sp. JJY06]|uniref:hypothetical protein n=1 Tax=Aeromicrobium sp. JJY06 TaxID=3373478 RepID=UPI00376ED618